MMFHTNPRLTQPRYLAQVIQVAQVSKVVRSERERERERERQTQAAIPLIGDCVRVSLSVLRLQLANNEK